MLKSLTAVLFALLLLPAGGAPAPAPDAPAYTADGALKLPANYREWVYLTSGLDMNYNTAAPVAGHSIFDNVFVNPSSYRAFLATGAWPDKTTFILEIRGADAHASIDRRGQSQNTEVHAIEAHAAVDTTFVQFYPTLIGLAKAKGTLSPAYLKDSSFPGPPPEGK